MKTIIWLARHGETRETVEQRFNGRRDCPLIDIGREHCRRLTSQLVAQHFDAIVSSPLQRCMETAEILARPHGLAAIVEKRFQEMDYGKWEGLTYDEARSLDARLYRHWENDPATVAPPEGESGEQVATRVVAAFEDILSQYCGQRVIIVAHKTVNRILLCTLLDLPISDHRHTISQMPCALSRIEIKANGQILVSVPEGPEEGKFDASPPVKRIACALQRPSWQVEYIRQVVYKID
jgi:broad specificity phosphatase PhoE